MGWYKKSKKKDNIKDLEDCRDKLKDVLAILSKKDFEITNGMSIRLDLDEFIYKLKNGNK